ncbi:MAG: dCMP deaminase family protein [Puniceicoccales bacterium]|nr:dCMP deaminase family protein [Puniceicoccales bacterium]
MGALGDMLDTLADRPTWEEYFSAMALLAAARSPCGRRRVGCVLVTEGEHGNRLIASGYNGFLPGLPHDSYLRDGHEMATVHAEQNAIADAAKRGVSVAGATAYVTHYPCIHCAKLLIAAGIRRVHYLEDYNNDPFVGEFFQSARVAVEISPGFRNLP